MKYNEFMQRIATSVVLTVALTITVLGLTFFFTGNAFAENHEQYESGAGITPSSFFYFLDRLAEKVQAAMTSDTRKKLDFAFARLQERTAEIKAIRKEKGYDAYASKEYEIAVGLQSEHIAEISLYMSKLQNEEIQRFYKKLRTDAAHSQEYLRQDLLSFSVKKKELREAIIEASKARDSAKTESLLEDLQKTKADYDRLAKLAELSGTATDIEVERIEDIFEDSMKREMVLERAKELESELGAYNPEGNAAVNALAIRRIREIIHKLKTEKLKKEFEKVDARLVTLLQDSKKQLEEFEKRAKSPEEKELDRKIVEEKAAKRPAKQSQPPEKSQDQQPTQKQASPPPLGQPKTDTLGGPIIFTPLINFQGKVGEKFEYSFCQPPIARTSDLCTAASTNPTGGAAPYHFQLGSEGFPPFGVTLNLNGFLSGTPSAEGTRTFNVCAVDLAGHSACRRIIFKVFPKIKENKGCVNPQPDHLSSCAIYCVGIGEPGADANGWQLGECAGNSEPQPPPPTKSEPSCVDHPHVCYLRCKDLIGDAGYSPCIYSCEAERPECNT